MCLFESAVLKWTDFNGCKEFLNVHIMLDTWWWWYDNKIMSWFGSLTVTCATTTYKLVSDSVCSIIIIVIIWNCNPVSLSIYCKAKRSKHCKINSIWSGITPIIISSASVQITTKQALSSTSCCSSSAAVGVLPLQIMAASGLTVYAQPSSPVIIEVSVSDGRVPK